MKIHKKKVPHPSHKERLKKKARTWARMTLQDKFTFGKYKEQSLHYAIETDPLYVNWLLEAQAIKIDTQAMNFLQECINLVREQRERVRRDRERSEQERRRYTYGFDDFGSDFADFFKHHFHGRQYHQQQRQQQQQTQSASVNPEQLHPAYRFDNLPERERYGKILRLSGKVTKEDIKSQYRKLALTFHPDKRTQDDEIMQETARIMFIRVQQAYEYFKKVYDL